MLCIKCGGTKKRRTIGFVMVNCNCDQNLVKSTDKKVLKIDKKAESYKTAIKEIMALDSNITQKQAEKMFKESYQKV
jgi:hypothetical protein